MLRGSQADGTGSGSCPMADSGISDVEHSGPSAKV